MSVWTSGPLKMNLKDRNASQKCGLRLATVPLELHAMRHDGCPWTGPRLGKRFGRLGKALG